MIDHGYMYVNIDDCWAVKPGARNPELDGPPRDAQGKINPNRRFPDMKALADYIHSRGLKAGIYTSPGPLTCAGYIGTYQHEDRTPNGSPSGASISSSTTGAPTVSSQEPGPRRPGRSPTG